MLRVASVRSATPKAAQAIVCFKKRGWPMKQRGLENEARSERSFCTNRSAQSSGRQQTLQTDGRTDAPTTWRHRFRFEWCHHANGLDGGEAANAPIWISRLPQRRTSQSPAPSSVASNMLGIGYWLPTSLGNRGHREIHCHTNFLEAAGGCQCPQAEQLREAEDRASRWSLARARTIESHTFTQYVSGISVCQTHPQPTHNQTTNQTTTTTTTTTQSTSSQATLVFACGSLCRSTSEVKSGGRAERGSGAREERRPTVTEASTPGEAAATSR